MMRAAQKICWGGWGVLALSVSAVGESLVFERDVRPILKVACFHCHGEDGETKGGLDVRLVRLMVAGGENGTALLPGDLDGSLLWQKISSDKMPKGEKKLHAEEKEIVRRWIEQGAKTARPEPERVEDARFTEEELGHWAFQPVATVTPPNGEAHPIDGFVGTKLREKTLGFAEPASRRVMIRRVTFNLTGLPPTPDEVEAYVNDRKPRAYERLIDRLLNSEHYGVRWARHWLDTAGYAESDGNAFNDAKRPHAWRYRDYVIKAFNENKPINEFILEQLAGDELIEGEIDVDDPQHLELLAATGFLRMAPDTTQRSNSLTDRNAAVAASMQVVSSSMLGLTVGCAQCHDHKYDPIGIDDYYRFRAIFDPAFPLKSWQQPSARLIDMTTAAVRMERDRIEKEAQKEEAAWNQRREAHGAKILEQKLEVVPEELREKTREAVLTPAKDRSERQKELLELYPMVKPVSFILGLLVEYDGAAYRKFEEEKKKIGALRAKKPALRMVMATTEPKGELPVSRVFFRGNPQSPRDSVEPAELVALRQGRPEVQIPSKSEARRTSGRRLHYAKLLTDGRHPLTARVFVNRVWQHHFGRGLVATPGDFGLGGEKPSHPELLDWLAQDFIDHGWDLKRLHRLIAISKTYQQNSLRRPELEKIDPDNALLGRMSLRRLDAEAIRDSLLSVSGALQQKIGGPPSPVFANSEGKAVLGGEKGRRSIFVEVQRRLPHNMLETFDQPPMTPNCEQRRQTTVATQALWFLNDAEILGHAKALAGLLSKNSEYRSVRLNDLYLRLFATPPTGDELAKCERFLDRQAKLLKVADPKSDARLAALESLCQVLLASNRFLYLD